MTTPHKPITGYARLIKRKRENTTRALAKALGKVDDLKRKGVLE